MTNSTNPSSIDKEECAFRLECLKMAMTFDLDGPPEDTVATAKMFADFVLMEQVPEPPDDGARGPPPTLEDDVDRVVGEIKRRRGFNTRAFDDEGQEV